jgi:hypothetical protein
MAQTGNIVSIHQPNYIPWLGYFYKIAQSDIFVFLDDVQFSNQGMQNYHYIKTPQGPFRLKIPVQKTFGENINQVLPNNDLDWKKKHLKTIEGNYKRSKYFEEVFSDLKLLFDSEYDSIAGFDRLIIEFICNKFGISTNFINSSELNIQSSREEKILDICDTLNCKVYYSGTGARAYQNEDSFVHRGIELKYSQFQPFEYPQLWGPFQANVTVVDYLMNCGYDWANVMQHQTIG